MRRDSDEFYVGYLPVPRALRRWILAVVSGLGALFVGLALVFVVAQGRFPASAFEFLQYREFRGEIRERPYPSLLVARPGAPGGTFRYSRYWLVAAGKHGAAEVTRGLDGKRVRLRGALIYRGRDTMIELEPGAAPFLEPAGGAGSNPTLSEPEKVTLTGQIVDSKCYLGVMNPGDGKVHRDCAVRCISGGIPPVFIARDASGEPKTFVLTGADGRQLNREVLDFVAEPITVRGELVRSGETLILRAEPASFVREGGRR